MTETAVHSHESMLVLLQALAEHATQRFDIPSTASVKLINLSENATYRVDDTASGQKWALRIHRDGYHSRAAIASELAWQLSLRAEGGVQTPIPIKGRDGEYIQTLSLEGLAKPRNIVLYAWEAGQEPATTDVSGFELLGETAARMHQHVRHWQKPAWFERHTWDFDTFLGDSPHWGRWRDGMGMTPGALDVFARTVTLIQRRLENFGSGPDRFGLVHGDMRLANLLMDGASVKVIDFDDCGFSWFLYDCATTVSFFENQPEVPELLKAWVRGYRRIGKLSDEEVAEIDTFVMLRRLLLVAWIGSHSETDLAKSMGEQYTRETVPLCEAFLARFA